MFPVLLFLILVSYVDGFCFQSHGRVDKTVTGRYIPVCEYRGLEMLDGSELKTADCMECKCTQGTLHCCGFGSDPSTWPIKPPVGCKIIADGCVPLLVLENDETVDCQTGNQVDFESGQPGSIISFIQKIYPSFPGVGNIIQSNKLP